MDTTTDSHFYWAHDINDSHLTYFIGDIMALLPDLWSNGDLSI